MSLIDRWNSFRREAEEKLGTRYLFLDEILNIAANRGYASSRRVLSSHRLVQGKGADLRKTLGKNKTRNPPRLFTYDQADEILRALGDEGKLNVPFSSDDSIASCVERNDHQDVPFRHNYSGRPRGVNTFGEWEESVGE